MPNFCSVEGCERAYYAKSFCKLHYMRNRKYGNPEYLSIIHNGLAKRFPSEHDSWRGAKYRCDNPRCKQYPHYGGRGIIFCDRWRGPLGFTHFMKDMGPKPSHDRFPSGKYVYSLDRINNDGPYSPENCRWATAFEQTYNRAIAKLIEINGETKTMLEWARSIGENHSLLQCRYAKGERGPTLLRPSRKKKRTAKDGKIGV